jgi:hypothetical protein
MRETEKVFSGERVTTAFTAFSEFLSQPCCRRCEVLEICVKRLRDDVMQHRAACPKDLLHALRRTVPFPASHASAGCGRCLPAEILMTYLTPGKDLRSVTKKDHTVDVANP